MKTVFVIGAGASNEVDMPLGSDLISIISTLFHTNDRFLINYSPDIPYLFEHCYNVLSKQKEDIVNEYRKAAYQIGVGLPYDISIDNFLYKHRNNKYIVACGKLAIAFSILKAEGKSKLYPVDGEIKEANLHNTWYLPCYQKITEGCVIENLPKRLEDISFIIFNYDRCFEHFMQCALVSNYAISKEDASSIVEKMNIFHPYGKIDKVSFGYTDIHGSDLLALSENIKTFTETIDKDNEEYKNMLEICKSASRMIYLGFDFHEQNMKLLFPARVEKSSYTIHMATCYNKSEHDVNFIKQRYESIIQMSRFNLVDRKCYEFFQFFNNSLSFVE
jgi:hypothetical protein